MAFHKYGPNNQSPPVYLSVRQVSANYTVDTGTITFPNVFVDGATGLIRDDVIACDSTSGAFTVTLPKLEFGRDLVIVDYTLQAAKNNITIVGGTYQGTVQTINWASQIVMNVAGDFIRLVGIGPNWAVIG